MSASFGIVGPEEVSLVFVLAIRYRVVAQLGVVIARVDAAPPGFVDETADACWRAADTPGPLTFRHCGGMSEGLFVVGSGDAEEKV